MILIENAHIVNEGRIFKGAVLVKNDIIDSIFKGDVPESVREKAEVIDASDCWLMPGVIDDHVHFRDPGMTEKADFYTESRAAVAGGVTSVMDMPNTNPATISLASWNEKMAMIAEKSLVNYSCYLGATNNNLDDVLAADPTAVCGIKLFIGSCTTDGTDIHMDLIGSRNHTTTYQPCFEDSENSETGTHGGQIVLSSESCE